MNLDGWDTCSIVSIDLVNAALAEAGSKVIRTFSYREDGLEVSGAFGSWSLQPGGTLRLVNVTMPITKGTIQEEGQAAINISGVSLTAQMRLGLIESDGADKRNLAFDPRHGEGESGPAPIQVIDIDDPSGHLGALDLDMVKAALTACLSHHAAEASFVFAAVDARSTSQAAGLACPGNDWAFVDAGSNRQYLAILGSLDKSRADGPIRIGPELMAPVAGAYFAVSNRLFLERALLPIISQSFKPRTSFKVKGGSVQSTKPVSLGRKRAGMFDVEPILRQVTVTPVKGALLVHAKAHADLPLKTRLELTVDMTLPFHHDAKTGAMLFRPDPHPVVKHKVNKTGVVGNTLGLIVELIVTLTKKPILASVAGIAKGMQAVANPTSKPVVWTGVRDFHAGMARWDNGLWLGDNRPVVPVKARQNHEFA